MKLTAARWLVLDNLREGWPYSTNLDCNIAGEAYLWCVNNELVKDGRITDAGKGVLAMNNHRNFLRVPPPP